MLPLGPEGGEGGGAIALFTPICYPNIQHNPSSTTQQTKLEVNDYVTNEY